MPRRVPSYCRYKPKNLGLVVINGKQHYLGKYGTPESLAEYHRLVQLHLSGGPIQNQPALDVGLSDPTVNQVILAFWRHAERHYRDQDGKPTGELDNLRDALHPLRKLHGSTPARSFSPLALRAVRDQMIQSGLCRTTVNARINRVRRVFKWAVGVEMLPPEIIQALQAVPGLQRGRSDTRESEGVKPVPVEHVESVLPDLPRPVAAMVRLQLLTGCRPGEVMAMRGSELVPGVPNWEYRPTRHKTSWSGRQRIIPLGPRAQEVLKPFLRVDPAAYLFDPREASEERHKRGSHAGARQRPREQSAQAGAQQSRRSPGPRYTQYSYRQAIRRACRRAGVLEWCPLQLRHTAATEIRAKYGLEAAQTVLGHAKADVTQIYAERDLNRARAIMAEVG